MRISTRFSNQQIVDFCIATADDNPIHNPEYMNTNGKYVVVPGMFLFSKIINLLQSDSPDSFDTYRVFFGNVISADEDIELGFSQLTNNESSVILYAQNGVDSFSLKGERSIAYLRSGDIDFAQAGYYRTMHYSDDQFSSFKKIVCTNSSLVCNFLFAISYASPALQKTIREPITAVEKEINILLDKSKNPDQVSPFYQSLEIYKHRSGFVQSSSNKFDYLVHFEREKLNRHYKAFVQCEQDGSILYQSVYNLIAIPDRLIMRMTKQRSPDK